LPAKGKTMSESSDIDRAVGVIEAQEAIEAMERRALHLSERIRLASRSNTPIHFREPIELKALRIGIRATREYVARHGGANPVLDGTLLTLLMDVADLFDDMNDMGPAQPVGAYTERMDLLAHRIDDIIGEEDE
jgi:hypothetical protein